MTDWEWWLGLWIVAEWELMRRFRQKGIKWHAKKGKLLKGFRKRIVLQKTDNKRSLNSEVDWQELRHVEWGRRKINEIENAVRVDERSWKSDWASWNKSFRIQVNDSRLMRLHWLGWWWVLQVARRVAGWGGGERWSSGFRSALRQSNWESCRGLSNFVVGLKLGKFSCQDLVFILQLLKFFRLGFIVFQEFLQKKKMKKNNYFAATWKLFLFLHPYFPLIFLTEFVVLIRKRRRKRDTLHHHCQETRAAWGHKT